MPHTIRLHRVLRAPPERIYRAFIEPAAVAKWNAPDGFTAVVREMDARVGGHYRTSFINFATGQEHAFGGAYHVGRAWCAYPGLVRRGSSWDDGHSSARGWIRAQCCLCIHTESNGSSGH